VRAPLRAAGDSRTLGLPPVASLAPIAVTLFVYALASRRLQAGVVSAPIAFLAAGFACEGFGVSHLADSAKAHHLTPVALVLVEVALSITLFCDAARVDFPSLRRQADLPTRLLGIGLPVTVGLGMATALVLLGELTVWEAALLAAILAPTDAALGQAVVSDERVPRRIRQTLNVESGLNDGIAIWFVTLFLTLAGSSEAGSARDWLVFAVEQLGLGTLVGVAVGVVGGRLVRAAARRDLATATFERLALLSLPVIAFAAADGVGGNGFIAAFLAGLAAGAFLRDRLDQVLELDEEEGQLLALAVFFLFGAVAWHLLDEVTWQILVYAVLSLTLVRMAPVALSLVGTSLHRRTVLFAGWFGPRGLASIAYALVILEDEPGIRGAREIILVMTVTVVMSVVAHGVSAAPLSARYGRWSRTLPSSAPELAGADPP